MSNRPVEPPKATLRVFTPREMQFIADFVAWFELTLTVSPNDVDEISKAFAWGIRNWLSGDTLPIPCGCKQCQNRERMRRETRARSAS